MSLERGRRASSVDRALVGWRREAVELRQQVARHERREEAVRSLIAKAAALLEDPCRVDVVDVHLHLLDALNALDGWSDR